MEIRNPESEFNMLDWWKKVVFDNYVNFDGRARRSEYWNFTLVNALIVIVLYFIFILSEIVKLNAFSSFSLILLAGFGIALLIPSIGVSVRRLHDTNKSDWFYLIGLIPIGGLVLLIFYCINGDENQNKYGSSPKK